MSLIRKHPAAVLALVSTLLFAGYWASLPAPRESIQVTREMVDAIVESRESLVGRPLTAEERELAVDAFIEDEVLVREAFRQGIDRDDRRVRQLLIAAAGFELLGLDFVEPAPTDAEVEAYFAANSDDFAVREAVSLEQLYFLPGPLPQSAESILAELRSGADLTAVAGGLGQPGSFQNLTRPTLSGSHGRVFADQVMALAIGVWSGPLNSARGTFFMRVRERREGRERGLEEVRRQVEQVWTALQVRAALREQLDDLRQGYRVEVEDGGVRQ